MTLGMQLHNDPAYIELLEIIECNIYYYMNGDKETDIIQCKEYLFDGGYHRENLPAVINYYKSGRVQTEEYFIKNKRHRYGGPASIDYYEDGKVRVEYYVIEGKPHREDGPSTIIYSPNGCVRDEFYYLNGIKYTDQDIIDN